MTTARFALLAPAMLCSAALTTACIPTDDSGDLTSPSMPPAESMDIDLSSFYAQSAASLGGGAGGVGAPLPDPNPATNYETAYVYVWALNLWVNQALAGPVAVFRVALTAQPVKTDNTWIWDFNTTHEGAEHQAVLSAWFESDDETGWLNLEMDISCPSCEIPTEDYLWYSGRFNTDGTNGEWIFYSPEVESEDEKIVSIAYDVTDATHRSIDATNIRDDGSEDAGDIIHYGIEDPTITVSLHDESEALDYVVSWSIDDGSGSITVPGYNNGEEACWDSNRADVACP